MKALLFNSTHMSTVNSLFNVLVLSEYPKVHMGVNVSKSCCFHSCGKTKVSDQKISKVTLRKGYYYSKQRTDILLKSNGQSEVWYVPIMLLDYPALMDNPEVKGCISHLMGLLLGRYSKRKHSSKGTFAIGDYGLARKEIQDVINDITKSTVGIYSIFV